MTVEQAIEFCLHMEKEQYKSAHNTIIGDYPEYEAAPHFRLASEYKQIAEWLTEYKNRQEENKVLISECDKLIKESGELLKKSELIAEYKRLMKAAVNDMNSNNFCCKFDSCKVCSKRYDISCDKKFQWHYTDKALKLIGDKSNGI